MELCESDKVRELGQVKRSVSDGVISDSSISCHNDNLCFKKSLSNISSMTDPNNDCYKTITGESEKIYCLSNNQSMEPNNEISFAVTFPYYNHPNDDDDEHIKKLGKGTHDSISGRTVSYSSRQAIIDDDKQNYDDDYGDDDYDHRHDSDYEVNYLRTNDNPGLGRDRRAMYVPSYIDGPLSDVDIDSSSSGASYDSRQWTSNYKVAADSWHLDQAEDVLFERMVQVSSSSSMSPFASYVQTERAESVIFTQPLPKQYTVKTGMRNFDQQISCSSDSPLLVNSPVTDRGESLVIECNKRTAITVKANQKKSMKVDNCSHGSKYGISTPTTWYGDSQEREPVGQTQQYSRPMRRSRNNGVAVVKAVVRETSEIIKASLIKSEDSRNRNEFQNVDLVPLEGSSSMEQHKKGKEEEEDQESGALRQLQNQASTSFQGDTSSSEEGEDRMAASDSHTVNNTLPKKLNEIGSDKRTTEFNHQSRKNLGGQKLKASEPQGLINQDDDDDDANEMELDDEQSAREDNETVYNLSDRIQFDEPGEPNRPLQRKGSVLPQRRKAKENRQKVSSYPQVAGESNQTALSSLAEKKSEESQYPVSKIFYHSSLDSTVYRKKVTAGFDKHESSMRKAISKTSVDTMRKKVREGLSGTNVDNEETIWPVEAESESFETLKKDFIPFEVVLHKTSSGYGMTMGGSRPVVVQASRNDGVAHKSGILPGDEIVKINGTYVYNWDHEKVIAAIKSAGPFLSLTLHRVTAQDQFPLPVYQEYTRPKHMIQASLSQPRPSKGSKILKSSSVPEQSKVVRSKEVFAPAPILGNEDLSDEEAIPIHPKFRDLIILKQNPAHLSVFLNYLISNSDPAPLLFSLITDYYQNAVRETGSASRWAFEIYTTFLASGAPLKLSIDSGMVFSIENVLQNTKETELRTVFRPAENFVRETILLKYLNDFHEKQQLGLGTMYGEHQLKENMDRLEELKIVDITLSTHFETLLAKESSDSSQAIAFCLATFFRQISFVGGRNSLLLESCPSFICKDKKVLKYKLKKNYESKGHLFNPHQYTRFKKCQNCEKLIWGIGFQAYQCSNCELCVHRLCADNVWQLCSGTLRSRTRDPRRVVQGIIGPSRSKTEKLTVVRKRHTPSSEKLKEEGSDADRQSDSDSESQLGNTRPSSWPNTMPSLDNNFQAERIVSPYTKSQLSDPDFDVEPELPPLSDVISKEALRKLKGKEMKKQQYINELFYTERAHLRFLKVLHKFFQLPMCEDGGFGKDFTRALFSNLDEVIDVHGSLNKDFKNLRKNNEIVTEIGDLLISWFSGDKGSKFKEVAAKFCQDQLFALSILKARQKKDPKLVQFLQEASLNHLCKRQDLKDLLPKEMQRLTKYPLLVDNIRNCTPSNTAEYEKLSEALLLMKELLEHVNEAIRDCENYRRTQEMQKHLDCKPIENSIHPTLIEFRNLNLTQHKMIYDGELTWRRSSRPVELLVALFEQFIILLQKQDDRLVLRCQSTAVEDVKFTYIPIIKLGNLMTKDVATDKRAFFLVNKSTAYPQVHELIARSKEDKNRWCSCIKVAVERYHKQYSSNVIQQKTGVNEPLINIDGFQDIMDGNSRNLPLDVPELNESVDEQAVKDLELQHLSEVMISDEMEENLAASENLMLTELQEKIALIHKTMSEKEKLGQQLSSTVDGGGFEESNDQWLPSTVRDLILASLEEVDNLKDIDKDHMQLSNTVNGTESQVLVSAANLCNRSQRVQQLLAKLTVEIIEKESNHERLLSPQNRLVAVGSDTDTGTHAATLSSSSSSPLFLSPTDTNSELYRRLAHRPTSYLAALNDDEISVARNNASS